MKVSKRTEYGLRAIVTLAELSISGARPVPLREIASQEQIPEAFLDQIFGALRKEGVVTSVRGASGGFLLAHRPQDIRMGKIVKLLEGSMAPIGCVGDDLVAPMEFCFKASSCHTRNVWLQLYQSIEQALDALSLSDVMAKDLGVPN